MLIRVPDIWLSEIAEQARESKMFTESEKEDLEHISHPDCLAILDDETKAKLVAYLIQQDGHDAIEIIR